MGCKALLRVFAVAAAWESVLGTSPTGHPCCFVSIANHPTGNQYRSELEADLGYGIIETGMLVERALADAPNGYTPSQVDCPSTIPSVRLANGLAPEEENWLKQRRPNTIDPMKDLLKRLNIDVLDTSKYINNHKNDMSSIPNIAIACSGGGWRALLNGAGT